jgi:hypothetical protein
MDAWPEDMAVPRRMFLYSPISLEYPIGKEENAKK